MPVAKPQKRLTLGYQINNLYGDYPAQLWPGINDAVQDRGLNLIVFPGRAPNCPYGYEFQSSVIYDFITPKNVDALVSAAGTLTNFFKPEEIGPYFQKFKGVPLVTISVKIPGIPAVLVDNKKGLKDLVRHLIRKHHCHSIALIVGPESNDEAKARYQSCLEVFDEEGVPFHPELLYRGDFNYVTGRNGTAHFLTHKRLKFDAVVTASDDMAFGVLEELKKHGLRVPEDVIVTGFDDVKEALLSYPPLSTVHQPLYQQAKRAVELVMEYVECGKAPPDVVLPTEPVYRASCGCGDRNSEPLKLFSNQHNQDDASRKQSKNKLRKMIMNQIIQSVKMSDYKKEDYYFYLRKLSKITSHLLGNSLSEKVIAHFLYLLRCILQQELEKGRRISIWNDSIQEIKRVIQSNGLSTDGQSVAGILLDKVRAVVYEMAQIEDAKERFQLLGNFLVIRNLLGNFSSTMEINEMLVIISDQLPRLECKSFYLAIYPKTVQHLQNSLWHMPSKAQLILGHREGGKIELEQELSFFSTEYLIPKNILPADKPFRLVTSALYYMQEQLGYILFEISEGDREIYDIIVYLISMAFKNSYLFKSQKQIESNLRVALEALQEHNSELQNLSRKDELTGLYNRRGFMIMAGKNLELAVQMSKDGVLFFADMDGLKVINDTYGHDEGDFAIQQCGKVLSLVFRNMDIIARLGGDEFTVLALDMSSALIETVINRLTEQLVQVNKTLGKPYKLSMSVGWALYKHELNNDLEDLMQIADDMLYIKKRNRKL